VEGEGLLQTCLRFFYLPREGYKKGGGGGEPLVNCTEPVF
jgi:hypothetical protein